MMVTLMAMMGNENILLCYDGKYYGFMIDGEYGGECDGYHDG